MGIPPTLLEVKIKCWDAGRTFSETLFNPTDLPVVPLWFKQFYMRSFSQRNRGELGDVWNNKNTEHEICLQNMFPECESNLNVRHFSQTPFNPQISPIISYSSAAFILLSPFLVAENLIFLSSDGCSSHLIFSCNILTIISLLLSAPSRFSVWLFSAFFHERREDCDVVTCFLKP